MSTKPPVLPGNGHAVGAAATFPGAPPLSLRASILSWVSICYQGSKEARHYVASLFFRFGSSSSLSDLEGASFVMWLGAGLCVMESYHAMYYTYGQLRQFGYVFGRRRSSQKVTDTAEEAPPPPQEERRPKPPNRGDDPLNDAGDPLTGGRSPENESDDFNATRTSLSTTLSRQSSPLPQWMVERCRRLVMRSRQDLSRATATPAAGSRCSSSAGHYDARDDGDEGSVSSASSTPASTAAIPPSHLSHPSSPAGVSGAAARRDWSDDDDADDVEEDQAMEATPDMVKHYWKQLEYTILMAPRHEQQLQRLGSSIRNGSFTISSPGSDAAILDDLPATALESEVDKDELYAWWEEATSAVNRPGLRRRATFSNLFRRSPSNTNRVTSATSHLFCLPITGCFLYHERPNAASFEPETIDISHSDSSRAVSPGNGEATLAIDPAVTPEMLVVQPLVDDSSSGGEMAGIDGKEEGDPVGIQASSGDSAARLVGHRATPLQWEAFFLLWRSLADVSASPMEIRALLLAASPPAFLSPAVSAGSGPTEFDIASANLALLWAWANVKRSFEGLVLHEDVQRCEAELEELESYAKPLYTKCIVRWPAPGSMEAALLQALETKQVTLMCAVQACWGVLRAAHRLLLSLRRRLCYRNTWSLVRYMYASSKSKCMSAAVIAALMALSSRVTMAGRALRERISGLVDKDDATDGGGGSGGGDPAAGDSASASSARYVVALCAFEVCRLAVQYVINGISNEFIALTAVQRREIVKMQLYEALSHTEISFYSSHTFDEVEELLYYVDDMEGIDVNLHQYLFSAVNVLVALKDALRDLNFRTTVVAVVVALIPYTVRRIGAVVQRQYLLLQREGYFPSSVYATDANGYGDGDDASFLREGTMMRGEEIIAAIPQLRPYGADIRLVRWWNRTQQRRQHLMVQQYNRRSEHRSSRSASASHRHSGGSGSRMRRGRMTWFQRMRYAARSWLTDEDVDLLYSAGVALVQLPHGKLVPGVGKGLLDLSEFILPIFASAFGVVWCGSPPGLDSFQLLEATRAVEETVDVLWEAYDMGEMIVYNSHKASMLERLLRPSQWELVSHEEEPFLANFTTSDAAVSEALDVKQQSRVQNSGGDAGAVPVLSPTMPVPKSMLSLARTNVFYRRYHLHSIQLTKVQFRYPTNCAALGGEEGNAPHQPSTILTYRESAGSNTYATAHADGIVPAFARPVSFDLVLWSAVEQRGRFICVTGTNGSGKTTLGHLLLALHDPSLVLAPAGRRTWGSRGRSDSHESAIHFCFTPRPRPPHHGDRQRRRRSSCNNSIVRHRGGLQRSYTAASASSSALSPRGVANQSAPVMPAVGGSDAALDEATIYPPHSGRQKLQHRRRPNLPPFQPPGQYATPMQQQQQREEEVRLHLLSIPTDILRRQLFSYVPDTPSIFSGATIAQNISLAGYISVATDGLMRRVEQCAELAQCHFIQQMPLGLLTRVCDSNSGSWSGGRYGTGSSTVARLSSDQAKRLMLARSYFHSGEILLLDEPTKEIEDASVAQRLCASWHKMLKSGVCSGIICMTVDEALLRAADEVIHLP